VREDVDLARSGLRLDIGNEAVEAGDRRVVAGDEGVVLVGEDPVLLLVRRMASVSNCCAEPDWPWTKITGVGLALA
jgi:hypothetical protein